METPINGISVNGIQYVPAGPAPAPNGHLKIVILQRGWVMVGYLKKDESACTLTKASVIRQWGTTNGLGELAMNGPRPNTKLDPCGGVVEFNDLTIVAAISCDESKWLKHL